MLNNNFSTCDNPPDVLKQRTEDLTRQLSKTLESGEGFIFGVLFDEKHCADIGAINGMHGDIVARLSTSFERLFVQQPDVATLVKEAMTVALLRVMGASLHTKLTNNDNQPTTGETGHE